MQSSLTVAERDVLAWYGLERASAGTFGQDTGRDHRYETYAGASELSGDQQTASGSAAFLIDDCPEIP